jgi:acyl carrier protein
MSQADVVNEIAGILGRLAQTTGATLPKIDARTELLGGALPIDSLDLASLVVELEEFTGHDPFQSGFVDFRTVGELAGLYQR